MHAVREDRARRQRVERHQPLERPGVAAPARVVDVGAILGDMDVDDRPELARERAGLADRVVGHGEARVQPDEAAHERRGARRRDRPRARAAPPRGRNCARSRRSRGAPGRRGRRRLRRGSAASPRSGSAIRDGRRASSRRRAARGRQCRAPRRRGFSRRARGRAATTPVAGSPGSSRGGGSGGGMP